ncbi:glycosyl transferase family 1 [Brachybacterium vulturis]|uniref:D-inositol 3-phosphate glycosyltransferase n=1 Tax=Brachybacterium vulturis TaxID=2017484 RepID=A0A291GL21_9MICO|nr:glycosyltransferase [Brachybacterium vulturis]ATG50888.1 glycosyl transferase family 1 [Brachybacterium vulturis]
MPSPYRIVRNARLLLQSAAQHLVDDPALLVVQVSRRLPLRARVLAGDMVRALAGRLPGCAGAAALGAFMAGDDEAAHRHVRRSVGSGSRLGGEVAVLLDRSDLLTPEAAPATRARAAWARGDLTSSLQILRGSGRGESRYARRLLSEIRLLSPGHRLSVPRGDASWATTREEGALRVLHLLTNSLPHTQSGYSLRSHRILTTLRDQNIESVALTRTGYPVMVGLLGAAEEDAVDGIRYVRTLPARLPQTQEERLEAEAKRAIELVAEFRPHVIHATTNYYNALVAQAVSAATGIPWVLEVRGLMEKTWAASHSSPRGRRAALNSEKARLVAARERELASDASAVVTLSDTMRAELVDRGVDGAAITVVPNGVEESLLTTRRTPAEARALLGVGMDEAFIIGAVSALVDYEGLDVLIRAVARLVADASVPQSLRDRLRVIIVGDGQAAPGLRVLAEELGIGERLIMPGRVSRHAAPNWVQALDVVAIPRRDVEVARTVTPQKPVEAMALGRPVIVSDLPALMETVTGTGGEICALIHEADSVEGLADAIIALAVDRTRANILVERGLSAAAERTWPALIQRYRTMYDEVITQEESARGR